jgi:DNA repair photolyase
MADPAYRVEAEHRRGRGAPSNASGRFERVQREAFDDGWDLDEETAAIETEVIVERARTIITRNDSPDIGFDRSINPYRGCEHGCSYCFARPSHAFQGLSPGLDFETKIFAKSGAADLLEKELRAPGYEPRTVAPMAARGLVKVAISVTTLDRMLARRMEPRAPTPSRRLDTIRQLGGAGIPVTVLVAPIIPAINDHEIEAILQASRDAGAREAGYVLLRLPHELKEIVRDWLQEHYPDKLRHVLSVLREARGGRDYDAGWTTRQTGVGPYAWMIGRRFDMALDRLHMNRRRLKLRTDLFTPPRPQTGQLSLF